VIFRWLQKKAEQTHSYEAERFLVSLQGADGDVIDQVLGTAMFWAAVYKSRNLDLYNMEEWLAGNLLFPVELNKMIKIQQKQGTTVAATGLMVWLFSARSLMYPEQRLSGRKIWEQLGRASLSSERIALESSAAMGLKAPWIDYMRVPSGLEKLHTE
jgi:hypothetical protein